MKSWKVFLRGRLERALIVIVMPFLLGYVQFDLKAMLEGGSIISYIIFFTSFIWIPVVFVVSKKLLTQKIPKKIIINKDEQYCRIIFSRKSFKDIPFEQLRFTYAENGPIYSYMGLYRSFIGSRGQVVTNEITEFFGLVISTSWTKAKIEEMREYLLDANIELIQDKNARLSIWERILSS